MQKPGDARVFGLASKRKSQKLTHRLRQFRKVAVVWGEKMIRLELPPQNVKEIPDAAGVEASRELAAHIKIKWQRRAEEFALEIFQSLPETDTGMNVFGELDERDGQFVECFIIQLARRIDECSLRFRNHATHRQSEASKPLVQSTGASWWAMGYDRCFEILLSGHLSINSCSSFLERIRGLDLIARRTRFLSS